jgi:hypothetical protein
LFTVTTIGPVVTPLGTGTAIALALQLVGVAAVPLKVTVLVPWEDPRFAPLMITTVPMLPDGGERLVMLGADVWLRSAETSLDSVLRQPALLYA